MTRKMFYINTEQRGIPCSITRVMSEVVAYEWSDSLTTEFGPLFSVDTNACDDWLSDIAPHTMSKYRRHLLYGVEHHRPHLVVVEK